MRNTKTKRYKVNKNQLTKLISRLFNKGYALGSAHYNK